MLKGVGMERTRSVESVVASEGEQPRPRADDVEGRAAGAHELVRGRHELPGLDARDRVRQLRLERGQLLAAEARGDDRVRALEEVVDDLDLVRAGPEARERVDEALQPVVGLDDLLRR